MVCCTFAILALSDGRQLCLMVTFDASIDRHKKYGPLHITQRGLREQYQVMIYEFSGLGLPQALRPRQNPVS